MEEPCEPYHKSHPTPCWECKKRDDRRHWLEEKLLFWQHEAYSIFEGEYSAGLPEAEWIANREARKFQK